MKLSRRVAMLGVISAFLSACSSKFKTYNGPEVTRIQVYKDRRKMYLFHGREVLETYKINLGFTARGPKQFEGDGKTPEGTYLIDRRNPRSSFHLSLGISYPSKQDIEFAQSQNRSPGGDIFIHGAQRRGIDKRGRDWTAGCIAVKDREIEDIYAMVRNGTPIDIFP